jgi:hypothetical protein
VTLTFPKTARYDCLGRRSLFSIRYEAEHRAHLKRVGHCFSSALLPDLELVVRSQVAQLLRVIERKRVAGAGPSNSVAVDMLYWFRMLTLDVAGMHA